MNLNGYKRREWSPSSSFVAVSVHLERMALLRHRHYPSVRSTVLSPPTKLEKIRHSLNRLILHEDV